ncbi:hypothetical protein SD81_037345 [Tolypothrix campylonemoides VB511288]|nr:hypothetical protein SD81_037345 [Tolypothrix campylonemoides VB511288]
MKCPNCDVALAMTDRQGIEIDYCPQCRGVWLDRGELDKLIERAGAPAPRAAQAAPPPVQPAHAQPPPAYPPQQQHGYGYGQGHYKYKKKKNLLGELFDF